METRREDPREQRLREGERECARLSIRRGECVVCCARAPKRPCAAIMRSENTAAAAVVGGSVTHVQREVQ